MKTFIDHEFPSLTRIDSDSGRLYETPNGDRYPSVTSITGKMSQKSIEAWKKRVGEAEANRVSSRALSRGTKEFLHLSLIKSISILIASEFCSLLLEATNCHSSNILSDQRGINKSALAASRRICRTGPGTSAQVSRNTYIGRMLCHEK